MSDNERTEEQDQRTEETSDVDEQEFTDSSADDDADADGDEDDRPLGPKGERALQAEKARRREATRKLREVEAELERLRNGDGDDADKVRRDAEDAATAKANARILRSEVKAAAAGKLADPKDALRFLDLEQFEVDEDGEVEEAEIAEAIEDLIKKKPYLAAQSGKRFHGTADSGARKGKSRPSQLTRADLKRMSAEQIVKAKAEGRLDDTLGINR